MKNRYEILRRLAHLPFLQKKKKPNSAPGHDQSADPHHTQNQAHEFEIDSNILLYHYDPEAAATGSKPDYAKLRAETLAAQARTSASLRPAPFDINRANDGYRKERETFVQARAAGKTSINDTDDWGMRIRMQAADRVVARAKAAQSRPQGMRPG